MIDIVTRSEYDYIVKRGFQPLQDWRRFKLDFNLRIDLQLELFGAGNFQQENQKFYKWCWDNNIQNCAETGRPLENYSAVFVSHIISRGSDRRMAVDPRNVNILSFEMHRKWESPNHKHMNIWPMNKLIINILKNDYNFA